MEQLEIYEQEESIQPRSADDGRIVFVCLFHRQRVRCLEVGLWWGGGDRPAVLPHYLGRLRSRHLRPFVRSRVELLFLAADGYWLEGTFADDENC